MIMGVDGYSLARLEEVTTSSVAGFLPAVHSRVGEGPCWGRVGAEQGCSRAGVEQGSDCNARNPGAAWRI